ncbi:MAG: ABC-type nitrate/sulfonate/bicarbonate transport system, periplasmic component [Massilibacillus sp.]|jgi:NitT/TauT family transport system substrate-binding protein|nr:ABC-type nitrate/sulfonate/bicarbonate transport system, periplasmic component [Massilibacillus sp.]
MGKINKWISFLLALVLSISFFLLTGCGSDIKTEKKNLKNFEIAAGNNSVAHVLAFLPKEAGFYEEEGLNVNINVANTNADAFSALTSGKVLACGGGSTAPLNLIEDGNDLVIIGGLMSEGAALFTLPGREDEWKNITPEGIKGKKIGVTRAQSGDIAFRAALAKQGIDLKTVEFVELGDCPTIIEAVKKGMIDAGIVFMTFRETAQSQGLKVAKHIDEVAPGFICCRLTTTKKALAENRGDFVKLIRAQIKAYRLYKADPVKTLEYAKRFVEIDEKILKSQLYGYGHLGLDPNPAKNKIEDFYEGMKQIGYVAGKKNIDDYIDTSVFEEALNSLLKEEPNDPTFLDLKKEFEETQKPNK